MDETQKRFWSKVRKTDTCWIWEATIALNGYGQLRVGGRTCAAHRLAYEYVKGNIPEGLVIDHLCGNRSCVNPSHLEAVTAAENTARGTSPSAIEHARRVATGLCPSGHKLSVRGRRLICLECGRLRWRARAADPEFRAARAAAQRTRRRAD